MLGSHLRVTEWESCRAPVADSAIFVGEFVALLVMVTLPVALPAFVGANSSLSVADWVGEYKKIWEESFDRLDAYLKTMTKKKRKRYGRKK